MVLLLLVLLAGLSSQVSASGLAVEGTDRARILPPGGARVAAYRNMGYSLEVVGDEVFIQVEAIPLGSSAPFESPRHRTQDPIARLARAVTLGAKTEFEAVSRALGWIARNIQYELDRHQPQDAGAVLERRSGYCTGVARLTVAFLEAIGIRAREVAGYVLDPHPLGEVNGFHRWVEVWISDRGWMFSDPLRSHHYVPATYVRLDSDRLQTAEGLEGLLLERTERMTAVDLYPAATAGITARRNSPQQLAAALRVTVEDQADGVAVLIGEQVQRTHMLIDGGATFVGLEPGRYRLRLHLPDRGSIERQVEILDRVRQAIVLPAPPAVSDREASPQINSETK